MRVAYTDTQVRALEGCTYCPRLCHFACPTAHGDGSEAATGWGLMTLANMLRRGELAPTPDNVELLYRCASCSRCTAFCVHDTPVAEIVEATRAGLRAASPAPEAVDAMLDGLLHAAEAPAAELTIHLGCADPLLADARDRLALLVGRLRGVEVAVVGGGDGDGRVACGGGLARRAGDTARADAHESSLGRALRGRAALTTCPSGCATAATGETVPSLIEALAADAGRLADLADAPRGRVTLHGGCRERRTEDLSVAERTVLAAIGLDVDDAFAILGVQECCGADPIYAAAAPRGAARAGAALVAGARLDTTRTLVTSNTRCAAHMRASSGEAVWSVLELVVERCTMPL